MSFTPTHLLTVAPGQQVQSGLLWTHHARGPLYMTTRVGPRSRRVIDQQPIDDYAFNTNHRSRPLFYVVVEPTELPK